MKKLLDLSGLTDVQEFFWYFYSTCQHPFCHLLIGFLSCDKGEFGDECRISNPLLGDVSMHARPNLAADFS